MKAMFWAGALAALCLDAGAVLAQDAPKGSAARGRALYVDLACHSCHGTLAQGGGRGSEPMIPPGYTWPGFLQQMRRPRLDMPHYSAKWVSEQDVADLYAYYVGIKPAPAAKDIPLLRAF